MGATSESSGVQLIEATRRRVHWVGWLANAVGSLLVLCSIGFLIPILAADEDMAEIALLNVPFMAVYFFLAGFVISRLSDRRINEGFGWLAEERPPDKRERRLTLGFAYYSVKLDGLAWAGGGVMLFVLNAIALSPGFAAAMAATAWLGGETTCALVYLFLERAMRPVTARALTARPPSRAISPGVRTRLMFAWSLGTGVPVLGVVVIGVIGLTKPDVDPQDIAAAGLFLGAVTLTAGMIATVFAARAIAARSHHAGRGGRPRRARDHRRQQRGRVAAGGFQPHG